MQCLIQLTYILVCGNAQLIDRPFWHATSVLAKGDKQLLPQDVEIRLEGAMKTAYNFALFKRVGVLSVSGLALSL